MIAYLLQRAYHLLLSLFAWLILSGSTAALALSTPPQALDELTFSISLGSVNHDQNQVYGYGYFDLDLHADWKAYWRNPGDAGLPLTIYKLSINDEPTEVTALDILWPAPHSFRDGSDLTSYGYSNHLRIPFFYRINYAQEHFTIHLVGEYAVCKLICVYHEFDEKVSLSKTHIDEPIDKIITQLLKELPEKVSPSNFRLEIKDNTINLHTQNYHSQNIQEVFVEADKGFRFGQTTIMKDQLQIPFTKLNQKADIQHSDLHFTIVFDNQNAIEFTISHQNIPPVATLSYMLLLAFMGGLILNIMPCVLPVVSLKLGQIAQAHTQSAIGTKAQLSYTALGILLSLIFLAGLIIVLKSLGVLVGWGFHFQQPVFVLFMMTVLIALTLSQLGLWFISCKVNSIHLALNRINSNNPLYHLGYGFIIALLASPCTAPFLGSAAGFALSQSNLVVLLIFFCIGLGLAFPYILYIFLSILLPTRPQALLPRPGKWLRYVQYIPALLLYASVLWLLFVLMTQVGALIACTAFILIHILVFLASKTRFTLICYALLITVILCPLYLHKLGYDHNNLAMQETKELVWHSFDEAAIAQQTAQNKTVFIDITAAWCLTCKFNALYTLSNQAVSQALSQPHIYLMRGDMTVPNQALLNFIKKHGRAGVPFNAIAKGRDFIILPEVLNKTSLIEQLKHP